MKSEKKVTKKRTKAAAPSPKITAEMSTLSPELYQLNSFRLLGLPITSSLQEVESAAEKLAMMKELGMKKKGGNIVPLPMNSKVGEAEVSQAIQKLRDPFKRIVQELFWYHPENYQEDGKGINPSESYVTAYKQLLSNSYDGAAQIWLQETESSSTTQSQQAFHNLAVLHHSRALSEETELEKDERKSRNLSNKQLTNWRKALQFWHTSWEGDDGWEYLRRRVSLLQDPRLKPAEVDSLSSLLPEALLIVNAQLISRYISSGYLQQAGQHIELLRLSPFGKQAVKKACRTVLDPLKEEIKTLCKQADDKMRKDSAKAESHYSWLYTNVKPLINKIKKVDPKNILSGETILDEVANSLRSIAVNFANDTKSYKKAGSMMRGAREMAVSPSIKKKIDEDIETCKSQEVMGLCWFCKKNPPDESSAMEKPMHKVISRDRTYVSYDSYRVTTRYKQLKLSIPRCKQCKAQHSRESSFSVLGGFLGFAIGIALLILINPFSGLGDLEDGSVCFVGAIILAIFLIPTTWGLSKIFEAIAKSGAKTKKVKPSSHFKEFPLYKESRKEGFVDGDKPSS